MDNKNCNKVLLKEVFQYQNTLDESALRKIYSLSLPLIYKVRSLSKNKEIEYEFDCSTLYLVHNASVSFNIKKCKNFTTYLYKCLYNRMLNMIRDYKARHIIDTKYSVLESIDEDGYKFDTFDYFEPEYITSKQYWYDDYYKAEILSGFYMEDEKAFMEAVFESSLNRCGIDREYVMKKLNINKSKYECIKKRAVKTLRNNIKGE